MATNPRIQTILDAVAQALAGAGLDANPAADGDDPACCEAAGGDGCCCCCCNTIVVVCACKS